MKITVLCGVGNIGCGAIAQPFSHSGCGTIGTLSEKESPKRMIWKGGTV